MSLKFERKLPVILLFVVIVITFTGFVFYQYTTSLRESIASHQQTIVVLSRLDETLRYANDVESGVRNFVITGSDTYLGPYERAKPRISSNLAEIRKQISADAGQAAEIGRLENWTTEFLNHADELVSQRKREGYQNTITGITRQDYGGANENIRRSIERIKAAEMAKMQAREQATDRSFLLTIWTLIIGSLLGIAALFVANFYVSHEMSKRNSAELALSEANRSLEGKVERRTAELQTANEQLELAAGEREELLEKEKSARKEAEAANQLRDDFMATVSHELRTPLNSILGWARMMRDGDLDDARTAKALVTIIKNSETQKRLIEDLMDVTRIMSGKLALEFKELDAAELVSDSVESIRPFAENSQIGIVLDIDESAAGVRVAGDRNRLMQVFTNLLTNAVKFTPAGGQIAVRASAIDDGLVVNVIDNGIGISTDFLPNVFERFRQKPGRGGHNGGLGLGLAIVRNLVELHGGTVMVESEGEGHGSTFTVVLPAANEHDLQT